MWGSCMSVMPVSANLIGIASIVRIHGEKLFCLDNLADFEVGADGSEHIYSAGQVVDQRDVYGLGIGPTGKFAVRNH